MEIRYSDYDTNPDKSLITSLNDVIIHEIVSAVFPRAIIVGGSFGRDEPTIREENGRTVFLSDCEISVVPDGYIRKSTLRRVKTQLEEKTGIEISLSQNIGLKLFTRLQWLARLNRRLNGVSIQKYDQKYGSKVIYGFDYLDKIPPMNAEEIPVREGIRLIFNRISELLMNISLENFYDENYNNKTLFWLSKTIIACQDAILIREGKYHVSYSVRNKTFLSLYQKDSFKEIPYFAELSNKATKFKLNPDNGIFHEHFQELWLKTQKICDHTLRNMVCHETGIEYSDYIDFTNKYLDYHKNKDILRELIIDKSILKNLFVFYRFGETVHSVRDKPVRIPWDQIIFAKILLVYFSLEKDMIVNTRYLNHLENGLNIPQPDVGNTLKKWNKLREEVTQIWYKTCY